jgi:tetratricopeptide (TPR) repeat protein
MEKHYSPCSAETEKIAKELDDAIIAKDFVTLNERINDALTLSKREDAVSKAIIYYCLGTAYGDLHSIGGTESEESLKKQLYFYRKSITQLYALECTTSEFSLFINKYKTNAHINYGNALCRCGRIISAIDQYKKALDLQPGFGMAHGNLAKAYKDYSIIEFDPGHQKYFHHFSYKHFQIALECTDPNTYLEAKSFFKVQIDQFRPEYIESFLSKELIIPQFNIPDLEELAYRTWAVENNLFLNTLNDLPPAELCFACDVLQLPEMIDSHDGKPIFHGMFNQIKQEYVFARYQYYAALQEAVKPHYADKDTHLINFADYPQYSMRIEQVKSSFKTLFSLLDKMAFFLNSYFDLGIKERDVSFSSIWKSERSGKHHYEYKNTLNYSDNCALSSLYWISRDLYDSFEDSPNPRLERIKEVRHALEHKYVKITKDRIPDIEKSKIDDLALYVDEEELYDLTMQLMHVVREAIICLSLSVHIEEQSREKQNGDKITIPVSLMEYDDSWKL